MRMALINLPDHPICHWGYNLMGARGPPVLFNLPLTLLLCYVSAAADAIVNGELISEAKRDTVGRWSVARQVNYCWVIKERSRKGKRIAAEVDNGCFGWQRTNSSKWRVKCLRNCLPYCCLFFFFSMDSLIYPSVIFIMCSFWLPLWWCVRLFFRWLPSCGAAPSPPPPPPLPSHRI